ncbi:unnamed protein product, partial [Sphagnum balticum]
MFWELDGTFPSLTVASLLFIRGRGRTEALLLLSFCFALLCCELSLRRDHHSHSHQQLLVLALFFFFSLHLEERQLQICERVRAFRKQERTFQEKFPLCASCILLLLVLHSCCYTNCCHDASTFCFYHSV